MTKLEEAYFHISNSGLTISMERQDYDDETSLPTYKLKSSLSAFGAEIETIMPLGSVGIVDYMIDALGRIRQDMIEKGFTAEYAFDDSHTDIEYLDGVRQNSPVVYDPTPDDPDE